MSENKQINTFFLGKGRYRTHVYRIGRGEAVVFLHGSGPGVTAWANWAGTLPVLGEEFDCIAPDLWGFGKSGHPDPARVGVGSWMDLWVKQVIDLLDELGVGQAQIIGNSMGGAIALQLLWRHPQRFKRAVLMGSVGVPFDITDALDMVWGFYEQPTIDRMIQIIMLFVYDPGKVGRQLAEIAQERLAAAVKQEVQRSYARMFPPPRQQHLDAAALPEEAYRELRHPVLLVHGRDDRVVPLETSLRLMSLLPDVQLHVFGACGHWVQIEMRDRFNSLVRQFLRGAL